MNSRRLFVVLMAVLTLVPLLTGAVELLFGTSLLAPQLDLSSPAHRVLDSNLRFFGGVWLGLGLLMIWGLRQLDRRAPFIIWLWVVIGVGGLGRALAMLQVGLPPAPFIFFTALELVGAPLFIWWLRRLVPNAPLSAGARL